MVISNKVTVKVDSRKSRNNSLNIIKKQLQNDIDSLTKDKLLLNNAFSAAKAEYDNLLSKKKIVKTQIEEKSSLLEELNQKISKLPFDNVSKIDNLKKEFNDISIKLDSAISDLQRLNSESASKKSLINTYTANLASLQSNKSKIMSEIDNCKKELNSNSLKLKESEAEIMSLNSDISNLNFKKRNLSNENSALHKKNGLINSDIIKKNNQIELLNDNIHKLELDIDSNTFLLSDYKNKLESIKDEITNKSEENTKLLKIIETKNKLESEISELKISKKDLQEYFKSEQQKKDELDSVINSIDESKKQIKELDCIIVDKKEEVDDINSLIKTKNELELEIVKLEEEKYRVINKTKSSLDMVEAKRQEVLKLIMINKRHLKSQEIARLIKEVENDSQ